MWRLRCHYELKACGECFSELDNTSPRAIPCVYFWVVLLLLPLDERWFRIRSVLWLFINRKSADSECTSLRKQMLRVSACLCVTQIWVLCYLLVLFGPHLQPFNSLLSTCGAIYVSFFLSKPLLFIHQDINIFNICQHLHSMQFLLRPKKSLFSTGLPFFLLCFAGVKRSGFVIKSLLFWGKCEESIWKRKSKETFHKETVKETKDKGGLWAKEKQAWSMISGKAVKEVLVASIWFHIDTLLHVSKAAW